MVHLPADIAGSSAARLAICGKIVECCTATIQGSPAFADAHARCCYLDRASKHAETRLRNRPVGKNRGFSLAPVAMTLKKSLQRKGPCQLLQLLEDVVGFDE